jgi:carboxymethylenebutenolidase
MKIAPGRTLEFDGTGGRVPIFEVRAVEARAAVVVVQEAFGVNQHIEDVARRLADAGYCAVAPQLFHRDHVNALPYDEMDLVKSHMANLTAEGISSDIAASLEYLAEQGFALAATGIVGFCMGGSVVIAAAVDNAFGAAVTFYGGGVAQGRFGYPPLAELAPNLRSPWLGVFGDLDASIPPEHTELLRREAAKAAVPTSVVRYAEAGHGFHCDARPTAYHEPSAKDAWAKAVDWLGRYLSERP